MVNILLTYLKLLNVFVKNEVRWGIFSFFSSTNVETKNVCPIAYNVWCYEQVCLAEMFKLPKMLLANLLIARVIRWHG